MPTPVFIWTESSSTQLDEQPRVRTSRFGDGYSQRIGDGLNRRPQMWSVRFSEVDNAIADEIIAFLRACDGVEAFDYTPLWHTSALKFICPRWSRVQADKPQCSDITATFEQVFEP